MKISAINSSYNFGLKSNNVSRKNPSFKADLCVGWGVRRHLGEDVTEHLV